uniref:Uncharacterized protein n=1 Tax=Micrurus lemniscatus lemniscatus TaxID=129467 RepID=A0A2D4HL96_MICLE
MPFYKTAIATALRLIYCFTALSNDCDMPATHSGCTKKTGILSLAFWQHHLGMNLASLFLHILQCHMLSMHCDHPSRSYNAIVKLMADSTLTLTLAMKLN